MCVWFFKAQVKVLCVEKDNIEKGIVNFISEHRIKKLVIEAAACRHYSRSSPRKLCMFVNKHLHSIRFGLYAKGSYLYKVLFSWLL
nr:U-box domain-containing protein 33-like [Ipomoea batatas]